MAQAIGEQMGCCGRPGATPGQETRRADVRIEHGRGSAAQISRWPLADSNATVFLDLGAPVRAMRDCSEMAITDLTRSPIKSGMTAWVEGAVQQPAPTTRSSRAKTRDLERSPLRTAHTHFRPRR